MKLEKDAERVEQIGKSLNAHFLLTKQVKEEPQEPQEPEVPDVERHFISNEVKDAMVRDSFLFLLDLVSMVWHESFRVHF